MVSLFDSVLAAENGNGGLLEAEGGARAVERSRLRPAPVALPSLPVRATAVVAHVTSPADEHHPDLALRLAELGFLPGERVRLVARGALGGPLAVRVGTGTFALRREEAACVYVWPGASSG